jgi:hypothetical protein
MSYNMMIGYDIYDCFTMEDFRLRQRMTLTIKIYCWRLYITLSQLAMRNLLKRYNLDPRCLSIILIIIFGQTEVTEIPTQKMF